MKYIIGFILGVVITLWITETYYNEFKDHVQTKIEIIEDGVSRIEDLD